MSHSSFLQNTDALLRRASLAARDSIVLQRFTLLTRILLAMGFIPTGMVKVLGRPFTTAGTDSPIGYFFDAMHRTGVWWQFIGLAQVVACVLLLIPRTATLGAVLFFPVMLNISIITYSLSFRGTSVVTMLMLLATVYLLMWDYGRIRLALLALLGVPSQTDGGDINAFDPPQLAHATRLEIIAYWVLAICGVMLFSALRSLVPAEAAWVSLAGGASGCLMLGTAWIASLARAYRSKRGRVADESS